MSLIQKTNYTIIQEGERFAALEDGKQFMKGFLTKEDLLHAVWVENGKIQDHFYIESDGVVSCVDRGCL